MVLTVGKSDILSERGPAGYRALQEAVLREVPDKGGARLAKVLPDTAHDRAMSPARQYPMGGGAKQWTIKRGHEKTFLIAMHVDARGVAATPGFTVALSGVPYADLLANRTRVIRYLENA